MLYDANISALKRCVRNNEKAPNFDLGSFVRTCGTFGCLVGNDWIAINGVGEYEKGNNISFYNWADREYQIAPQLRFFLFSTLEAVRDKHGRCEGGRQRSRLDREAALNRLRKFIAYIERKRAIWYEADGRVSELARKREGDWGVCASVLNSIAVSA